ncbi:MAG: beta-N-acetylhexosaminidase [Acidimicrobiales bacterium]
MSDLTTGDPVALVPRPLRVTLGAKGSVGCLLHDGLVVSYGPGLVREARWFGHVLEVGTGWLVHVAPHEGAPDADIELILDPTMGFPADVSSDARGRHDAAYRLTSSAGRIVITSPGASGAFYALQTLRQLLPDESFRGAGRSEPIDIPELEIVDAPRLPWRGVLLDVARHFMPKAFVLELIDLLALHKCNVLHLHLTDDQGWRFEVEGYPRLTEVGAWRRDPPPPGGPAAHPEGSLYGGFYTRQDLEEIVTFAAERHVLVLPEIDMPGHMLAAIAAYPALGNTDEQLSVAATWGVSSHVLNLEDDTLRFCTDVLDEVLRIFPGPYVHVGGDECPTTEWTSHPRAQKIMQEEGYENERQLQGWFTTRIGEHLARHRRQLVAWDDILEGGSPSDAILMAWQDEARGVAAVAAGHDVVMVPQEWLYFDRPESSDPAEPAGFPGVTTLEEVYLHDPVPAAVPAAERRRVLGAQCQLWTEHVITPSQAEYLYFPRLCAFAETVWTIKSPERPGTYQEFEGRLARHLGRLAALGVNFRPLEGPNAQQARAWSAQGTNSSA